ncbi:MAG: 1-(5-phosphoribosyl)-5-[(5-phosphoribosylamino)methylideneamino]imidazole-4-carboxamide isomerase [Candidatus Omnitrophota bacterium]
MIILPAIDIIEGKVVRLHQGNFKKKKKYSDDPLEVALKWQEQGAEYLHIVDLDGAKNGKVVNQDIIAKIIQNVDMKCEVGGGIKTEEDIAFFLSQKAERVVLGTTAIENKTVLKKLVSEFKEKIVVSIDFKDGFITKAGWMEKTDITAPDFAEEMKSIGLERIIVTDIATDGTLEGPNIHELSLILDLVDIKLIASGGISSLNDIRKLKEIRNKNLEGAIIGKALYENKIDLAEAISVAGGKLEV